MPNLVDNRLVVLGEASELDRFLTNHLRATACADGRLEFDFASIIPVTVPHSSETLIAAWGTKWTASETMVRRKAHRELEVNFVTPWTMPEPIYRQLGRLYPRLSFRIEAIDPDCWAVVGKVEGYAAEFRACEDFGAVFDRFYSVIGQAANRGEAPRRVHVASGSAIEFRIIERKY